MDKRKWHPRGLALAAIAVAICVPTPSLASHLSGAMMKFRSLRGAWTCASTISGPHIRKQKITMLMTFDVTNGNVLHDHLSAEDFDAHLYYGYSTEHQRFWAVTANNDGMQLQQESRDGLNFDGSIVQHPKVRIKDAFRFVDDRRFSIHDLTTLSNGHIITTDSSCVRH